MPSGNVLHANLTPEAYDGWISVCGEAGVSMTALAEALGTIAEAEQVRDGRRKNSAAPPAERTA